MKILMSHFYMTLSNYIEFLGIDGILGVRSNKIVIFNLISPHFKSN